MIHASVVISRDGTDLTIGDDASAAYCLTDAGLSRPVLAVRSTAADTSAHVEGNVVTAAVRDVSALPLEVVVFGTTSANLEALLDALADALFQFRYTATVTLDGVATSYSCSPTAFEVVGGSVLYSHASRFFEVVAFTIPVQPTPVSL